MITIPDEYKGLKGFIRKILGGDKSESDTVFSNQENLFLTKEIRTDTSILNNHVADSALILAKGILTKTALKEKWVQKQLNRRELALLKQNQVFMSKIKIC